MGTVLALLCLLLAACTLAVPPVRRIWREILLSLRYVLWELPLRAITGRWKPDGQEIAAMEHGLGLQQSSGRPWFGCCACPLCSRLPRPAPGPIATMLLRQAGPPGPPTVDEWRHAGDGMAAEVQQTLASAYVRLSQPAVLAPWQRRWLDPANGSRETDR